MTKNKITNTNTDNIGHLFVTVFALLLPSRQIRNVYVPGFAHLHAIKHLHREKLLAPRQILPRRCATAFDKNSAP